MPDSTAKAIVTRRSVNQRLAGPRDRSAVETVARMGAIQAQDYAAAKWAVALRGQTASAAEIERLLDEGQILRTHVLRPTWHFVAPADIRWLLALTASRVRVQMASTDRTLGIDDAVVRRSNKAIAKALRDGPITRTKLGEILHRSRIDTTVPQRLGNLMMHAELDGVVCSGPRHGKQFTYALLDARAPATSEMSRDESLAKLAARYFSSHGPATAHDFAWWSGLTLADSRRGAAAAAECLRCETIDGHTMWSSVHEPAAPRRGPQVLLLPNFDEYYIAYKNRSHMLDTASNANSRRWAPSLTDNLVSLDGRLVGSWKQSMSSKGVTIAAMLAHPLSASSRARLAQQAKRYAAFLDVPLAGCTIELRDHKPTP
ncbi:MAG TPA: winged helix DNA-binding domain-containing protein [Gemmatimonadaceae bacterium]|jgi:hypothetical protein